MKIYYIKHGREAHDLKLEIPGIPPTVMTIRIMNRLDIFVKNGRICIEFEAENL